MAQWQRTIRLQPTWDKAKSHEISIQELAAVISKKLKALRPFNDDYIDSERDNLVDEFEGLAEDESADREDFDDIMCRLYDWGDMKLDNDWNGKKVCWIDTISGPRAGIAMTATEPARSGEPS